MMASLTVVRLGGRSQVFLKGQFRHDLGQPYLPRRICLKSCSRCSTDMSNYVTLVAPDLHCTGFYDGDTFDTAVNRRSN
jgi:hypothetical protein